MASSVNNNDSNTFGSFVTVTLRGKKPGQLDFEYQISASKTNNDILVSLGRSNNTGKAVDVVDMDYFVSNDVRLGSTTEHWTSLGTMSQNREYYDLAPVVSFVVPKMYQVNHVIKDMDTGNSLLMGHVTITKGASRFEVAAGWQGKTNDRMKVRGYCSYKVTMPSGKSFAGEKLLIDFNTDALRAMEHQGDLIALAYDIRLKQRRPMDLNDRELVVEQLQPLPRIPLRRQRGQCGQVLQGAWLERFLLGTRRTQQAGEFWVVWSRAETGKHPTRSSRPRARAGQRRRRSRTAGARPAAGGPGRTSYPDECYLPIHARYYGMTMGTRVIDFSNPLTIKLERERAFQWVVGHEKETGRAEMDFADWWDKWPGQYDPYMSALETYRAAGTPWREVIDQKAPRRVIRSNMNVVDHTYGIVDIDRVSNDADHGYEEGDGWRLWLTESLLGSSIRFFYNGRVFWNDGDGFHVFKSQPIDESAGRFNYAQAKVDANFHAFAGSTLFLEEAFNEEYPADRIELLKRISPPTPDVSYPVDLFVRKPAQIWNMPVERPFGKWNVLRRFQLHLQNASGGLHLHHAQQSRADCQVHRHPGCGQGPAPRSEQRVHRLRILEQEPHRDVQGDLCAASGEAVRLRHLQHRRKAGSAGADLDQPAYPADGLRHQGPGLRRPAEGAAGRFARGCRRSVSVAHLRSGRIHGKASGVVGRTYRDPGDQRPFADRGLHFFNGQGHRMESVLLRPNNGGAAAAEGA